MGSYFPKETKVKAGGLKGALPVLCLDESLEFVTGLVQCLTAKSQSWEVAHALTGAQALEIARKQPIDVALLSASAPNTDVIEVANTLTQINPKLIVFILAPDAKSSDQAYSSGRHQWHPKNAPAFTLVAAVNRMTSLVSWLSNNTTLELVSGIHGLPTIPSNYQGVLRTINSPNSTIQDIGTAMEKDMGMTSRVLQVANSAIYGFSSKITSPTQAAQVVGVDTLKSLVRYTHVLNNFPQSATSNAVFDKVWSHSVGVAAVARKITLLHTKDETRAEEAFTAGLLHDIGKLVLMSIKPEDYKEVLRKATEGKSSVHLVERVKLGTTHSETGAYLLSLWGIPYSILEAVAWHHYPGECKDKEFSALTAVHIANVSEHRRTQDEDPKAMPALDERYLAEVGVAKEVEEWLKLKPDQPKRDGDGGAERYVVQAAAPKAAQASNPIWPWLLIGAGAIAALVIWLVRTR